MMFQTKQFLFAFYASIMSFVFGFAHEINGSDDHFHARAISAVATPTSIGMRLSSIDICSLNRVIISEFRVRGPNGGNDEFIELLNASGQSVNISGWKVQGSNNIGSFSTRTTIFSGITLLPYQRYLIVNNNAINSYSGSVASDQNYSLGISDDGGVALTLADGTIVDQVGLSSGSAFKEGTELASLGSTNADRSYVRQQGGFYDSDDNSSLV